MAADGIFKIKPLRSPPSPAPVSGGRETMPSERQSLAGTILLIVPTRDGVVLEKGRFTAK